MLRFDHVIMTVRDFDAAALRLFETHGLASVAGGRHHGHGTGNRIVPLGTNYLELMAVVDPAEAESSPLGRWVGERVAAGDDLAALCLRTGDIDEVGRRIGREPERMARRRPDGVELSWWLAGLPAALMEGLPFFIQWDVPAERRPGRTRAAHRVEPAGITWVEMGGDPGRMAEYLGPNDLDLRLVPDRMGVCRLGIATRGGGEIVL